MILKTNTIPLMFGSRERPFGLTWEEWTTRWWKWFLSIPKEYSPAIDETSERAATYQYDPQVWFLASTTDGIVERNVKISSGMALLFPVINVTISNSENPALRTDGEMISFVRGHMDDIVKKQVIIDGQEIVISEKFRVQSPPFDFTFPSNNIFDAHEGPTRGVGDGYWIFLKPLQPGNYYIRTHGSCMSGKIQIIANIRLIVE
jgi:hypothetical protein